MSKTRAGTATEAVIKVTAAIGEIPAADWDACAIPDAATLNPFVTHTFLKALEDAKCVGPRTGWLPQHLMLEDQTGAVSAVAPAYAKSHSQGEYVFDYGWADAYERAGGRYYPKLQVAVPFTPVPGARLLARPGPRHDEHEALLASGIVELTKRHGFSSAHVTFLTEGEWSRLSALGFLQRTGKQYHFANEGYGTFEEFLGTLASRKRKSLRKERTEAVCNDVRIDWLTGGDITEAHWDAFYQFYMQTGSRKWGRPYLNRTFFSLLGERMADRCLLVMAKRNGRLIAGALNLIGGDCLYGRYWGAIEHHQFLHFEVCYYQAIEFAIARKLARVEAGAQGDHKLARGYMPVATYSSHWIADGGFERAVARFLDEERRHMAEEREMLAEFGPFRKGPPQPEQD
ncbi:MAG: GNAT family N-acetyltransferase [Hyphomicrobiaceae bacterium]